MGTLNVENTKVQMRKGILEFCILSILSSNERAYSSDILSILKDAKLLVVEGTLYPLLTRLKNGGLVTYEWVESSSGPPRKYYQLTGNGRKFLEELNKTWHDLVYAVELTTKKDSDSQKNTSK